MQECHPERSEGSLSGERSFAPLRMTKRDGLLFEMYWALRVATPEIFNTDQGVQFTSAEFTNRLKAADVRISWDGRGRAFDNIFVERVRRCAFILLVGGVQHH